MKASLVKASLAALFAAALFVPAPASAAYRCVTNPAICQAICGGPVCGSLSARDRDAQRLEKGGASARTTTLAAGSKGKKYTCFNPAICRAVCGSPSC